MHKHSCHQLFHSHNLYTPLPQICTHTHKDKDGGCVSNKSGSWDCYLSLEWSPEDCWRTWLCSEGGEISVCVSCLSIMQWNQCNYVKMKTRGRTGSGGEAKQQLPPKVLETPTGLKNLSSNEGEGFSGFCEGWKKKWDVNSVLGKRCETFERKAEWSDRKVWEIGETKRWLEKKRLSVMVLC